MNCEEIRERLPWLEAGSLDAEETRAVEEHLAGCPDCQAERAETRIAGGMFATMAHPSVAELVEYCFGDASREESAAIGRHLEVCAECREEAALVEESVALVGSEESAKDFGGKEKGGRPPASRWGAHWPSIAAPVAAAASFVALVSVAGWIWTFDELRRERRAEPRTDLAVLELMSAETVLRSPGMPRTAIAGDRDATLILVADTIHAGESYSVRLETSRAVVWEGRALAASANELTLHLPAGTLSAGGCLIRVVGPDGSSVATFEVDVR